MGFGSTGGFVSIADTIAVTLCALWSIAICWVVVMRAIHGERNQR